MREALPDFVYAVDDLARLSDETLAARGLADSPSLVLWLLRDIQNADALLRGLEQRAGTLDELLRGPNGTEYMVRILHDLAHAATGLPFQRFCDKLVGLVPAAEEHAMTIAEELRSEGRRQGLAQGREEGRALELHANVLAVLEARGLRVPEHVRVRVEACDDLDVLEHWLRRAAMASSATEVLD